MNSLLKLFTLVAAIFIISCETEYYDLDVIQKSNDTTVVNNNYQTIYQQTGLLFYDDYVDGCKIRTWYIDLDATKTFTGSDLIIGHDTICPQDPRVIIYTTQPYGNCVILNVNFGEENLIADTICGETIILPGDTIIINDTTIVHDTTIIDNIIYVHDTTIVHDTITMYDIITIHDTTVIHDTTIVHDTTYIQSKNYASEQYCEDFNYGTTEDYEDLGYYFSPGAHIYNPGSNNNGVLAMRGKYESDTAWSPEFPEPRSIKNIQFYAGSLNHFLITLLLQDISGNIYEVNTWDIHVEHFSWPVLDKYLVLNYESTYENPDYQNIIKIGIMKTGIFDCRNYNQKAIIDNMTVTTFMEIQ